MSKLSELLKKILTPSCRHGYDIFDVIDLKKDPRCVKCGRRMSEVARDKEERLFGVKQG